MTAVLSATAEGAAVAPFRPVVQQAPDISLRELLNLKLVLGDLLSFSDANDVCAFLRRFDQIVNDPKLWLERQREQRRIYRRRA